MAISEPHENVDKAMHMRDTGRAIIAQRSELSLNYRYTELKDKKCLNWKLFLSDIHSGSQKI